MMIVEYGKLGNGYQSRNLIVRRIYGGARGFPSLIIVSFFFAPPISLLFLQLRRGFLFFPFLFSFISILFFFILFFFVFYIIHEQFNYRALFSFYAALFRFHSGSYYLWLTIRQRRSSINRKSSGIHFIVSIFRPKNAPPATKFTTLHWSLTRWIRFGFLKETHAGARSQNAHRYVQRKMNDVSQTWLQN